MPKKHELPIPGPAQRDDSAQEIVRVWAAAGAQHVALATGLWHDPAAWGILLDGSRPSRCTSPRARTGVRRRTMSSTEFERHSKRSGAIRLTGRLEVRPDAGKYRRARQPLWLQAARWRRCGLSWSMKSPLGTSAAARSGRTQDLATSAHGTSVNHCSEHVRDAPAVWRERHRPGDVGARRENGRVAGRDVDDLEARADWPADEARRVVAPR